MPPRKSAFGRLEDEPPPCPRCLSSCRGSIQWPLAVTTAAHGEGAAILDVDAGQHVRGADFAMSETDGVTG